LVIFKGKKKGLHITLVLKFISDVVVHTIWQEMMLNKQKVI